MTRLLLIFSFLLLQSFYLNAQNLVPQIEFIKNYGGNGGDGNGGIGGFHFTQDGYILYAGVSTSNTNDLICNNPISQKAWLLKTDKQGNEIFSNCFGGALENDFVTSSREFFDDMVATKDSGCIATCYTTSAFSTPVNVYPAVPFPYACDDSANGYKMLSVVKYDKNGNIQWTQCYGGGQDDGIYSIDNTSDGGYIFLAQVRSIGGQVGFHYGSIFSPDCWLVKLDSAGNIQWKEVLGGTGADYARKVKEISPGRYMTSIATYSTDGNLTNVTRYSNEDAWLCLFDSAGNTIKQAVIPWYGEGDEVYDFITTSNGGLICAGLAKGNNSNNNNCNASTDADFAIFKLDSSFQIQWCNIQDSSGGTLYSITALSDSLFLACGNSQSTFFNSSCALDTNGASIGILQGWMICIDINGTVLWRKSICASQETEVNYSLIDTATGAIYVSGDGSATDGDLTGVPNYGGPDEWLFKIALVPNGVPSINADNSIAIYPNPAQTYLYVTLPPSTDGKITLTDITGKAISVTNTNGKTSEILNIGALPSGVYILSYQDANICVSKKVVKE